MPRIYSNSNNQKLIQRMEQLGLVYHEGFFSLPDKKPFIIFNGLVLESCPLQYSGEQFVGSKMSLEEARNACNKLLNEFSGRTICLYTINNMGDYYLARDVMRDGSKITVVEKDIMENDVLVVEGEINKDKEKEDGIQCSLRCSVM